MNRLTEEMKQQIMEQIGEDDLIIEERDVRKNNDTVQHGVTIRRKEDNIAPTIYIDDVSDDDIVRTVVDIYKKSEKNPFGFNIDELVSRENVLKNVYPAIVNRNSNEERIKETVHRQYVDDLEITYRVVIKNEKTGNASFVLKPDALKSCNISEEELHEAAMKNVAKDISVKSMADTMREIIRNDLRNKHPEATDTAIDVMTDNIFFTMPDSGDSMIVVITNKNKYFGAATILNESTLVELHDKLGDFYILPSSIHEVLAVPAWQCSDVEELRDMVREVNDTQVAPDEVLSYNVYMYSKGKVSVA